MIVVRPAVPEDAELFADKLRPEDAAECFLWGAAPADTIKEAMAAAVGAWAALDDGEPVAIYGLSNYPPLLTYGLFWTWTTPLFEGRRMALLRHNRDFLKWALTIFPHLHNYVDARHPCAVAWARRLGFTVHPPACCSAGPFVHRIEMSAP